MKKAHKIKDFQVYKHKQSISKSLKKRKEAK